MTVRTSLARLVRCDPDRPTLRERAATLRASASRILHRHREERAPVFTETREGATDWASPPRGFIAYSSLYPSCFMRALRAMTIEGLAVKARLAAYFAKTLDLDEDAEEHCAGEPEGPAPPASPVPPTSPPRPVPLEGPTSRTALALVRNIRDAAFVLVRCNMAVKPMRASHD